MATKLTPELMIKCNPAYDLFEKYGRDKVDEHWKLVCERVSNLTVEEMNPISFGAAYHNSTEKEFMEVYTPNYHNLKFPSGNNFYRKYLENLEKEGVEINNKWQYSDIYFTPKHRVTEFKEYVFINR